MFYDVNLFADKPPRQEEPEKNLLTAPNSKSSAPPTPLSAVSGISPASSPLPDDLDLSNVSPSWPNTPTSPVSRSSLFFCVIQDSVIF